MTPNFVYLQKQYSIFLTKRRSLEYMIIIFVLYISYEFNVFHKFLVSIL